MVPRELSSVGLADMLCCQIAGRDSSLKTCLPGVIIERRTQHQLEELGSRFQKADGQFEYSSAEVAQLAEHQLPKLRVAGSYPVFR